MKIKLIQGYNSDAINAGQASITFDGCTSQEIEYAKKNFCKIFTFNPAEEKDIGGYYYISGRQNGKTLMSFSVPKITLNTAGKQVVDKVIYNNPATIILWKDGSKTVVKCQEGDTYDEETGFVMAYLKKLLGNDNTFNKEIAKHVPTKVDEPEVAKNDILDVGTRVMVCDSPKDIRVKQAAGLRGTIKTYVGGDSADDYIYGIEFDRPFSGGHSCNGTCAYNRGLWVLAEDIVGASFMTPEEKAYTKLLYLLDHPRLTKKEMTAVIEDAANCLKSK